MLVDRGRGLCAAVAFGVVEIKRVDAEFADHTLKRDAAVERLGTVIAHVSIVVSLPENAPGQEVLALRLVTHSAQGS